MLAEVPIADRSCLWRRPAVHPRADDEPRRARLRSRCAGAQAGVVPRRADRPVAFVVPSAEIEDRHPHLVVTRFDIREVPVRAVVRMVEPFEVEGHGTSEHRLVAQRNPQQRFAAVRLPPLSRVFHGLGTCSHTAAASVVWRDVDGNPRQPRQIERAAEIEELARRGEAHRRKRADEMRRRFDGSQPLRGAGIGEPGRRNFSCGPRLSCEPLDRVVTVETFVLVGVEHAVRRIPPAHVLDDHGITALDCLRNQLLVTVALLAVRRADHEHRPAALPRRLMKIGRQPGAVACGNRQIRRDQNASPCQNSTSPIARCGAAAPALSDLIIITSPAGTRGVRVSCGGRSDPGHQP